MSPPTPWTRAVGARIQRARKALGLSQEAAAELLDVSTSTISRYERGHVLPTLDGFAVMCEALKVSADQLLARDQFVPRPVRDRGLDPLAEKIRRQLAVTPRTLLVVMRRIQLLQGDAPGSEDTTARG